MTACNHATPELPARIGPAEFGTFGQRVAVSCPADLAPLVQKAGGIWARDPNAGWWSSGAWAR
jgi:hypothetical protein